MSIRRRRVLQGLALASAFQRAMHSEGPEISHEVLKDVSRFHGMALSDTRLNIIRPALERRLSEIQALRDLELDETIGLTQGILSPAGLLGRRGV